VNARRPSSGEAQVAPFVARKAKALDLELGRAIRRVLGKTDEEAVHDMRVAIRRLRTMLRFARPVFGRFHADAVRRSFADVQAATGELRDEEVLGETLEALGIDDAIFRAWRQRRHAREIRLRSAVIAHLRTGELTRARRMLHGLLLFPVKAFHNEALGKFARRAVTVARKNVESLRDVPTSDAERLHTLRIQYKKLRYAAEIFREALPLDLAVIAEPAARFQKRIGDIHDLDMALAAIARARGLPAELRARVAGALVDARAKKARKYLDDMAPSTREEPREAPSRPSLRRAGPKAPLQAVGGVGLRKISTF
jgi:CHAD domain-containing protein